MRLAALPDNSGPTAQAQTAFAGIDYRYNAGNGAIVEEVNCSSAFYPALASRPARRRTDWWNADGTATITPEQAAALGVDFDHPNGLYVMGEGPNQSGIGYSGGHHYQVYGDTIYRNGYTGDAKTLPGGVTARRTMVGMGGRLIVFPDKVTCDTTVWGTAQDHAPEPLEARYVGAVTMDNGEIHGESAEANTLRVSGVTLGELFKPGDGLSIGGTPGQFWDKTVIVREVVDDGATHELRFDEGTFTPATGVTLPITIGTDPQYPVTVARTVPDLDFLCEQGNRLWGCKGDTIYCSKLGDPTNWSVYDGLSTDSWTVDTGSPGSFTGCVSFLGYPIFFKADRIYKVYGSRPENYELVGGPGLGVRPGCGGAIAAAQEVLYYISRVGPVAYTGGLPRECGEVFGERRITEAVGGSDGRRYYVAGQDTETKRWRTWVYDSRTGIWSAEDSVAGEAGAQVVGFAYYNGGMIRQLTNGESWYNGENDRRDDEDPAQRPTPPAGCMVRFGDWDYTQFSSRSGATFAAMYPVRLWVRIDADEGVIVTFHLRYDGATYDSGSEKWVQVAQITGGGDRRDDYLALPVQRCRRYALRISTTGPFRLLAIERELVAEPKARR